jgi:hypothetical protein
MEADESRLALPNLNGRAHASAICNGGPIKTCESATGKGADNKRTILVIQPSFSLRLNTRSATMSDRLYR